MNQLLQETKKLSQLPNKQQVYQYSRLFNINPHYNPVIAQINNEQELERSKLNDIVDNLNLYDGDWLAINEMVISFIRMSNQLNPWSLLESFDLYIKFLEDLTTAFINQKGWVLIDLVKLSINFIIPMANKLDLQLFYKESCSRPRLSHLASILLKIFNNIRSQTNEENRMKTKIILFIGNNLCKLYFKILNPLLCRNVFTNINTLDLSLIDFNKYEILQYRFYLSKFYLIKNQFIDSFQHLEWCLINYPVQKDSKNITKIIELLIPVAILIGKKPNFQFLILTYFIQVPSFIKIYQDLHNALQMGYYQRLKQVIDNNYQYFKQKHLLITIESKSLLILLRNLFKKIWIMSGKPLKLEYDQLLTALIMSDLPVAKDDLVIENLLVNLIDQNMLKGKIFPRLRVVSLAKTGVFPYVDEINFIKFGNGNASKLNPNDSWLQV